MANTTYSTSNHEYILVDTAPESDAEGYFTGEVDVRLLKKEKKVDKIYFSIREAADPGSIDASVITVSLQFKCDGDVRWQDYVPLDGSTLAIGNRISLEDFGPNVKWSAGVKTADYTSGSLRLGFDW